MAAPELNCPNCGAPLQVDGHSEATTVCPFCDTTVILPAELRPAVDVQVVSISSRAQPTSVSKGRFPFLLVAFILLIGFTVPTLLSRYQQATLAKELVVHETSTARVAFFNQTAAATSTPEPTLTPTPPYASPVLTFGEVGIGEGMFSRSGYIAADGQGNVYVADYEGGRIQRFDTDGHYLSQWRVGDSQTFIHGMSAAYNGAVFVSYGQVIEQYDGSSGNRLNQMIYPEGGEFGDLAATADGGLAAMWYEGRWGLITSLEGHREELVIFNAAGEIERQFPNVISAQTDSLALDVDLAVDGAGTLYALSDGVIFQFSPEGKFLDRINHLGDQPGQYSSANAFAVDGQGRLFIVDGREISVYDAEQRFIDQFSSPDYIDALAIDPTGGIWAAAESQVIHFGFR